MVEPLTLIPRGHKISLWQIVVARVVPLNSFERSAPMSALRTILGLASVALLATLLGCTVLQAADPDKKADAKQTEKEPAKNRFQVPEGRVKELIDLIKELRSYRPATAEEAIEYRTKAMAAMKTAAEKIQEIAKD